MNDSKIPVRYSRALFQLAVEKKVLDKVFSDMELISEICRLHEVQELLFSPIMVPSKKREVLVKIFGGQINDLTTNLIVLAVKNGRESYLPAIARAFIRETKEYKGITETILTTAVEVDKKVKEKVRQLIAEIFKTNVDMKEVIDPEIIGGFVLKVEDKYIDASVRSKLRKIEKELKGNTLTA